MGLGFRSNLIAILLFTLLAAHLIFISPIMTEYRVQKDGHSFVYTTVKRCFDMNFYKETYIARRDFTYIRWCKKTDLWKIVVTTISLIPLSYLTVKILQYGFIAWKKGSRINLLTKTLVISTIIPYFTITTIHELIPGQNSQDIIYLLKNYYFIMFVFPTPFHIIIPMLATPVFYAIFKTWKIQYKWLYIIWVDLSLIFNLTPLGYYFGLLRFPFT